MTKLDLTQKQFEDLHVSLDKSHRSSLMVKVDRESLAALLRDHSKLLAKFKLS